MMSTCLQKTKWKNANILFGIFLISGVVFAFFSHPFLRLPYDPWEHLIKIRSIYDEGRYFLYWPEDGSSFWLWHLMWAEIFSIINIDDTLLWAEIIHRTQSILALLCVFYFSSVVYSLLEKKISRSHICLLAFFATVLWLVGNGTYSIEYQQAWIVWYSVTYQGLTIPIFWLIAGFALQLFFNVKLSLLSKLFLVMLSISGFLILVFFHPTEAIYYLIILVLSGGLTPFISCREKILWGVIFCAFVFTAFSSLVYLELHFIDSSLWKGDFGLLAQKINVIGSNLVENGGNRLQTSFSEIAFFSFGASLAYLFIVAAFNRKMMSRVFVLLVLASTVMFIIPTTKWIAGVAGLLSHQDIVWRFFFAIPWFVFLPFIVFKLTSHFQSQKIWLSVLLIACLVGAVVSSKNYFSHTLYGNVQSLYRSFFKERIGLQYNEETLANLKDTIEHNTSGLEKKNVLLYLRGDMATLARAIYGYYAFSHRRVSIPMDRFYASNLEQKYQLVPVVLPRGFAKDRSIFLYFRLDTKSISHPHDIDLKGNDTVVFDVEHIDLGKKYLCIEGWGFLEETPGEPLVYVTLRTKQETLVFDTSLLFRGDVGDRFASTDRENTGFFATISLEDVAPNKYRIGVLVDLDGQQGYAESDYSVKITKE